MIELRKEDYQIVTHLLARSGQPHVFAYSVVDQIQSGKVYVDRVSAPACCLILSDSGKYLVVGSETDSLFTQSVVTFLGNPELHKGHYDLYVSDPHLLDYIRTSLYGRAVQLTRTRYELDDEGSLASRSDSLADPTYRLTEMDAALYTKYQTAIDASYKLLWRSPENFLSNGFGYCVTVEGEIASACNTYYRGAQYAEIDIMTLNPYRNQGLAQVACSAYIDRCRQDGLTPVWDCDAGNAPSNRLAAKIGFKPIASYDMLWWHADPKVMESYLKSYKYIATE